MRSGDMTRRQRWSVAVVAIAAILLAASTQVTIFVIPPIGAVPEGRTLIISRMKNTQFIDSADAMCERIQGGVNLMCRGFALAAVAGNSKIYARLPYSETLNSIANDGRSYDR